MKNRPHRLPYRAKDGIVEVFFKTDDPAENLSSFFDRAITWSQAAERGSFRLLDSFLSDALTVELLSKIFDFSSLEHPVQILIVDPGSDFALARAKSIGQVAAHEVRKGIVNILTAIHAACSIDLPDIETSSFDKLVDMLHELAQRVFLEVRFYSEVPSGPHYFLKDLLVSGRFCAGLSSSKLPWTMIVDDPAYRGDLYDVYSNEFHRIWAAASPRPERRMQRSGRDSVLQQPSFDLAIIAATEVEWSALWDLPRVKWEKLDSLTAGSSIFYGTKFERAGREISVVATRQADPGMVCASIATSHLLQWARVSFLAAVGICAGVPKRSSLCSIVIADQVFDAQAGKFAAGKLQSNIDSITLDRHLVQALRDRSGHCLIESAKALEGLMVARKKIPIVFGKVATVNQVIADAEFAKQAWSQSRHCVALDMESYGIFRAAEEVSTERRPRSFFIKAAVDLADHRKSDRYQRLGAALSSNFLWHFSLEALAK